MRLFKITFCDNSWATVKLESCNLASVCKKSTKNSQEAEFGSFDFFQFYWIFSDILKEKQTTIKLPLPVNFCIFFLHTLAKFQDSSFTVAQVISQNVILNKSHFCKKISSSRFFCDSIHSLYLCDNFGVFNINIDNFIGKNSEKITKNYPTIFYVKVKTPGNWISHIFGTELNFDIP